MRKKKMLTKKEAIKISKKIINNSSYGKFGSNMINKTWRNMSEVKRLVDKFLQWPVPDSVNCDPCMGGEVKIRYVEQWPNSRSGTSILSAIEAEQMIQYLLKNHESELTRQNKIMKEALEKIVGGLSQKGPRVIADKALKQTEEKI